MKGIKASDIEIGEDGMPSDPRLRTVAVAIRFHMAGIQGRKWYNPSPSGLIKTAFEKRKRKVAEAVWKALEAAGSIQKEGFGYVYVDKGRLAPVDAESRRKNFLALVDGVASRLCETEEGRRRMAALFLQMKTVYGVHVASMEQGAAVVVATEIAVAPEGARMASGFAVLVAPDGLFAVDVPFEAISQSFEGDLYRISIDRTLCAPNGIMQATLDQYHISPFTSRHSALPRKVNAMAKAALAAVGSQREACSAFVGEEIGGRKWLSFMASLRRTSHLWGMFSRILYKTLDPEIRRAAMRNPVGTAAQYSWLCGGARRIQASAVYPVLLPLLPSVEEAIDRGESLNEALSSVTGLKVPALRRMAGFTWQKLGANYRLLAEARKGSDVFEMLSEIPPERVPVTRGEWERVRIASQALGAFGWPSPGTLSAAFSKDWRATERLVGEGLPQAVRDTAFAVIAAADRVWSEGVWNAYADDSLGAVRPAARLVLEALSTGDGLGRLKRFNADWHKGERRRSASMKAIRRRIFGEKLASWAPLWREGTWKGKSGTLEFLCDEDRLAEEGSELTHCVGSYWHQCLSGQCHIAAVRSVGGGRSTVEFVFFDESLVVAQHRAAHNDDPSEACARAVDEFMKAAGGKMKPEGFLRDPEEVAETAAMREVAEVDAETAREILALYKDCLPASVRERSPGEWADMMRDAGAWRVAREPELQAGF